MYNNIFDIEVFLSRAQNDGLIEYKKDFPLSKACSFKIGGKADYVAYPKSVKAFCALTSVLSSNGIYHTVIGKGTNVLFSDKGFRGVVVFTTLLDNVVFEGNTVNCECGASVTHISSLAAGKGLSGLEFAYGIPGTLGGAVFMNAGAYGGEIKDVVKSVMWYDVSDGTTGIYRGEDNRFDYRASVYQNSKKIILSAELELHRDDKSAIEARMTDYMQRRRDKQPLEYPSAGSTFKRYPGYYTGKLIEDAGLKGFSVGGAQVSDKHAGFVINKNNATADDVLTLIDTVKKTVYEKNGIMLECEIRLIPFTNF